MWMPATTRGTRTTTPTRTTMLPSAASAGQVRPRLQCAARALRRPLRSRRIVTTTGPSTKTRSSPPLPAMRILLFSLLAALVLPAANASAQAVLRNGDIFELRLSGMPSEYALEYSLQYTVGDNGEVSLAQLNAPIKAAGLSTTQLERTIEKRLVNEKIFTNPTAVVMLQPSSRFVTVGGAVRAPSSVAWAPDMTLSVALKRAGGPSD